MSNPTQIYEALKGRAKLTRLHFATGEDEVLAELQRRLTRPGDRLGFGKRMLNRVVCRDGFSVSVQAGSAHYCTPRNDVGPYTHVEASYPTEPMPDLAQWCEALDGNPLTVKRAVWGWVPLEVLAKELASRGGIVIVPTPQDNGEAT